MGKKSITLHIKKDWNISFISHQLIDLVYFHILVNFLVLDFNIFVEITRRLVLIFINIFSFLLNLLSLKFRLYRYTRCFRRYFIIFHVMFILSIRLEQTVAILLANLFTRVDYCMIKKLIPWYPILLFNLKHSAQQIFYLLRSFDILRKS